MKFIVLFIVCCVALAAADDEIAQEEYKESIIQFIEKHEISCENHKEKCNTWAGDKVPTDSTDYVKQAEQEICVTVLNQYLCEGKSEGDQFADVYKQGTEMVKNAEKSTN